MDWTEDPPQPPLAGHYAIERELGRGGMATVYLARDLKHDRPVALKVLRPELSASVGRERFLREIRTAARLEHPGILPLYDSGETDGLLYYVMPYVDGETLRQRLQREGQLGIEEAVEIARQVAAALSYAHEQGIIHRDIKPENILLWKQRAVLADFGIARALNAAAGDRLTGTGLATGTPAYMSPEQAGPAGRLDGRSDLYGLACVLYEMLAGAPPFTGTTPQTVLARHSLDPVPPLRTARATVPEPLERAVMRALAKVPADRFRTLAEFAEALARAVQLGSHTAAAARAGPDTLSFWRELKRRHVYHVGVLYCVFAWALVQVAETTFPYLGVPAEGVTAVIVLAALGFPAALGLAWLYEITADGIRRTGPLRVAAPVGRRPLGRALRPGLAGVAGAGILVGFGWVWTGQSRAEWARSEALPQAMRLMGEGKTHAAFQLLRRAEASLAGDPVLEEILLESTVLLTIRTTPPGAAVHVRDFHDEPDAWEFLGHAPVEEVRVPRGSLVYRLSLEGFQTREGLLLTHRRAADLSLQPAAEAPAGMVHIPDGQHELFSTGAVVLPAYWIDKYEVTNRQFKEFIDRGGYDRPDYWTEPFVRDGQTLSWDEAHQHFRDRTGRPGPSTFELGSYADGHEDHPVGGVSWYEAAAYCTAAGKQLPTLHHWYHTAVLGEVTQFASLSNFDGSGPQPVGRPRRIGVHGTYDMAGNVKEWTWNDVGDGRRYILGGAWSDPSYQFRDPDAQRPFDRQPTHGFRCAKYSAALQGSLTGPVAAPFRDYRLEAPASDAVFTVYQSLYQYDPLPLEARVESVDERMKHWRIERISFAAAYGNERVPALLFLPKEGEPPYQTVVYYPGAGAFFRRSTFTYDELQAEWFPFLVRSGRAVIVPVYKGTHERSIGPVQQPHTWRDVMIFTAKDLRRAIDYLETRPDIDSGRLAYFGLSMGAAVGPIMTALEPRFDASVLLGGGLYLWQRPQESEAFNFLPRVKVPTLMLNGRHDFFFPYETSQLPLFERLGTAPADKRHHLFESGHIPIERQEVMKEILQWLDRYLGPVTGSRVAATKLQG